MALQSIHSPGASKRALQTSAPLVLVSTPQRRTRPGKVAVVACAAHIPPQRMQAPEGEVKARAEKRNASGAVHVCVTRVPAPHSRGSMGCASSVGLGVSGGAHIVQDACICVAGECRAVRLRRKARQVGARGKPRAFGGLARADHRQGHCHDAQDKAALHHTSRRPSGTRFLGDRFLGGGYSLP